MWEKNHADEVKRRHSQAHSRTLHDNTHHHQHQVDGDHSAKGEGDGGGGTTGSNPGHVRHIAGNRATRMDAELLIGIFIYSEYSWSTGYYYYSTYGFATKSPPPPPPSSRTKEGELRSTWLLQNDCRHKMRDPGARKQARCFTTCYQFRC